MIIYDIESYPNFFSLVATSIDRDDFHVWEISERKNDSESLLNWLTHLSRNKIEMIGFNNEHFDYVLLHLFMKNPLNVRYKEFHIKTEEIIFGNNRYEHVVWPNERFIPQIDLFKIWHFDNRAKTQSLKGLQFNMRSPSVVDLPFAPGTDLTQDQMNTVITYNRHDVLETRRFARISLPAIEFRKKLISNEILTGDVLNFNDTKIGKELLIQRLGDFTCYDRTSGRRQPRQTFRHTIALDDVIFDYVTFDHPEFVRIHQWMKNQTLVPEDVSEQGGELRASTKGVFKDVKASINGFDFHFGTGGIHGSVSSKVFHSDEESILIDADVASLYPSIAIVNRLYPEHLGEKFVEEYSNLKTERFKYAKGTPENGTLKLGLNGAYGASNDVFSPFYDPKFTMAITINGQLMLCMLAEWLMTGVEGLELIQINTDGLTCRIPRSSKDQYDSICKHWEKFTMLDLEFVEYQSMWIRDVNNYVAKDVKGKIKTKGAYWAPDPLKYEHSISNAGPPAWHKDLSAPIIQRAAVAKMIDGIEVEWSVRFHHDPFDFMMRAKAPRSSKLMIGDNEVQRITRYYIAKNGGEMFKVSPPVEGSTIGAYKRKNGVSQAEYNRVMKANGGEWDESVCTKNRSVYEDRKTAIQAGWKVAECNNADDFDWSNLNHEYYIEAARKLVIE